MNFKFSDDPNSNFPREQLQYLQEIGIGWFGRVVEGEASQICDNEEKTSVIVKILREEASPSEHLHFLHEVRPYRFVILLYFFKCNKYII